MKLRNEVTITGRVLRISITQGRSSRAEVTLAVPYDERWTAAAAKKEGEGKPRNNFPRVIAFSENAVREAKMLSRNDIVTVKGHLQTRKNNDGRSDAVIVADTITRYPNEIEKKFDLGEDGRGETIQAAENVELKSEILLRGELIHRYAPPDGKNFFTLCTIRTHSGDTQHFSFPQVCCYGDRKIVADSIPEKSEVAVIAIAQTKVKTIDGQERRFENYIATSIAMVAPPSKEKPPMAEPLPETPEAPDVSDVLEEGKDEYD